MQSSRKQKKYKHCAIYFMMSDINTGRETHKGGLLQANSHINIDAIPKQDISKTYLIVYLKDQT